MKKMIKINSVAETLLAAKAKIKDKRNWTQNTYAIDVNGFPTHPRNGYSFCAIGAIKHVNGIYEYRAIELLEYASERKYRRSIIKINDSRTTLFSHPHKRVLKVYDLAIKMAKERDK